MPPYVDSGILIKLYVRERNSAAAIEVIRRFPGVHLNQLQELEIRNTLRVMEGRGLISPARKASSEHLLDADIMSRRLGRISVDWSAVFREAQDLSRLYSAGTLARSLDILHVAAAVVSGIGEFITGDKRQQALASSSGLTVQMIE